MQNHRFLRLACVAPVALFATAVTASEAPAVDPAAVVMPAPVPARWSAAAARDLLEAVNAADREGLDPAAYHPAELESAIAAGPGGSLDATADRTGLQLARDYLLGRVADKAAFDWHIERSPYEAYALSQGLANAAADGKVAKWLASLLPTDPQYRALRSALADAAPAEAGLIRANMERWRWLPRDMGEDYLWVNVPTYRLQVVRDGVEAASYDVVVGAPKTPTPALAVAAERVVVNPWWTLPPSVLAEGGRYSAAKGYVTRRAASGRVMVQQKPGPMNALGRIKIDMPNPHAIYLHDTPAKAAFRRADRALSHGCIRVAGIDQLAAELQDDGTVEDALAGDTATTRNIALAKQVPVYIVYMTAQADGGRITPLKDIYGRDARLLAALGDGTQLASAGGGTKLAAR